jgi:serine/threonine protein kinase
MLQEQTVVGDCYIIQSRVGEDACSELWMATAIFSAKRFLLRFLKPEHASAEKIGMLRKRAIESYHIRGEFIKDFVELEYFDGRLFISSEFYDERTLAEFFSFGYTMSLVHICKSIRMLAQGLLCFHEVGILYGNLSPENIVAEIRGREIVSLKIVKPSLHCESDSFASAYLAPECKAGKTPSIGSDIYSLGILVVCFITGSLPFEDGDVSKLNPSLRYVTNALFRRGIPEKLVRIVLGMLMPSLPARYDSCAALLSDLQHFMSFPEQAVPREPLPGETRSGSAPTASFRSFDTTNYFDSLANGENSLEHAYERVYPVKKIDDLSDAEKTEREEMRILPEEGGWSIDDYIAYGKRTVPGIREGLTTKETESYGIQKEASEIPRPDPSLRSTTQTASAQASIPVLSDTDATGIRQLTVQKGQAPEKRTWTHHRIQVKDVYQIVHRSAQLASKGRGSFRYIQEPESGYADSSFYQSLESLSPENLYVNAGSCARYGIAGLDDFLGMLRKSFASVLSREPQSSVVRLAKKISRRDVNGFFAVQPLGKVLYGNTDSLPSIPVSPDTDSLQVLADCICAFAQKKRPLVLVIRGGERISRELQDFFTILAGTASTQPVCVVVFFDRIAFEPWQTLSVLSMPQGLTMPDETDYIR